jgi:hypothetical protein
MFMRLFLILSLLSHVLFRRMIRSLNTAHALIVLKAEKVRGKGGKVISSSLDDLIRDYLVLSLFINASKEALRPKSSSESASSSILFSEEKIHSRLYSIEPNEALRNSNLAPQRE